MEMCENFGIEIDASSAGALQVGIHCVCDLISRPRWSSDCLSWWVVKLMSTCALCMWAVAW